MQTESKVSRKRIQARAPTPEIDLALCELDCVIDVVYHIHEADVRRLAEHLPRPVPPKRRKSIDDTRRAIVLRWAYPDCRTYLQDFVFRVGHEIRAMVRDREQLKKLLDGGFEPTVLLYQAHLDGKDPAKVLARMPAAAKKRFPERQEVIHTFVDSLQRMREEKVAEGNKATQATIAKATERRTRELKEQIGLLTRKHERAEKAISTVASTMQEQVAQAQQEIETHKSLVHALQVENNELRHALEEVKKQKTTTALNARTEAHRGLRNTLAGFSVLVVGDENRATVYQQIVERFGASYSFISGFSEPRRVDEALSGTDAVVLVTTWVSHKVSGRVTASGRAVIYVNVAGERAMREALGKFVLDLALSEEATP